MGDSADSWLNWCRLCAKRDPSDTVNSFETQKDVQYRKSEIKMVLSAIEKFASIKIVKVESLPIKVCNECFSLITSFLVYCKNVKKAQERFSTFVKVKKSKQSSRFRLKLEPEFVAVEQTEITNHGEILPESENVTLIRDSNFKEYEMSNEIILAKAAADELDSISKLPKLEIKSSSDEVVDEVKPLNSYDRDYTTIKEEDCESDETINNKEVRLHGQSFPCHECPTQLSLPAEFFEHMSKFHNKRKPLIDCIKCERKISSLKGWERHESNHINASALKTVPCNMCSKKFMSQDHVERHKKYAHLEERPHVCEVCGYTARLRCHLNVHMRQHRDEKPYECDICHKKFKTSSAKGIHKRRHSAEHTLMCPLCGRLFKEDTCLKRHMSSHSDERPYKCEMCGRAFKALRNLQCHKYTHDEVKRFRCDGCNKSFTSPTQLSTHKKRHCIKPKIAHIDKFTVLKVACPYCPKEFPTQEHMEQHKKNVHLSDNPHICVICGFPARLSSILKIHMQTHLHEKPFQCNICDNTYKTAQGLKGHQKSHTNKA